MLSIDGFIAASRIGWASISDNDTVSFRASPRLGYEIGVGGHYLHCLRRGDIKKMRAALKGDGYQTVDCCDNPEKHGDPFIKVDWEEALDLLALVQRQ